MIEKIWLVNALSIGINYYEFWTLTPKVVMLIFEGYTKSEKRKLNYDNMLAYIQGRYMVDALVCTVGNMFSKKGAKQLNYPKEPYNLEGEKELTQEEKDVQANVVIANLMRMKENFERAKVGGGT